MNIWENEPQQAPQPTVEPTPTQQPKKRRTWLWILAIIAAFSVGAAIGGTSNSTDTAEPATKTVTKTETVEKTPQACLDALDASERLVHQVMIPFTDSVVEMFNAAAAFNFDAMNTESAKVDKLSSKATSIISQYNAAADECRTAS